MKNLQRLAYFTTLPLTGRGGDGLGPGPRRWAGVPAEKGGRRMVLEVNNTLLECTEAARWLLVCASGSYGEVEAQVCHMWFDRRGAWRACVIGSGAL